MTYVKLDEGASEALLVSTYKCVPMVFTAQASLQVAISLNRLLK